MDLNDTPCPLEPEPLAKAKSRSFCFRRLSRTKRGIMIGTRTCHKSYQPGPSLLPASTPAGFQEGLSSDWVDFGPFFDLVQNTAIEGWEAKQRMYQTWSFGFQFRLGKHFSDEHWLPFYYLYNWIFWTSPNIWRDTVSKWTHWLLKEGNNLEKSLYCACWGCYPRL